MATSTPRWATSSTGSPRNRWSGSSGEPAPALIAPLAVAIIAAALVLPRLGTPPFLDPPEGIHAQIAWEMLRGGDLVTPHLDGVPYFDKPPLFYWLTAAALAWLGPTETAARLISAVGAIAVAVITALIGTRLASPRVGFLAGLMAVANLELFIFGRLAKPDLLFVACMWLGLYGFVRAYLGDGRWALYLFYGSLGLAVVAKDLLGALGPLALVGLFLWLTGEQSAWRQWAPAGAVGLLLVVAAPWHVLVEARYHGFLWYTIVDNHLLNAAHQRVFPDEDVPLSTLEFLIVTAVGFFPWALALPLALWRALPRPRASARDRLWALLAIWVIGALGVLALAPFKLPHYGLPAFPAMALMAARVWDDTIEHSAGAPRSWSLLLPALVAVAVLALGALLAWRGWLGLSPDVVAVADVSARNMAAQGQPVPTGFIPRLSPLFGSIAAVFGLLTLALTVATWRRRPRLGLGALLAGMVAVLPLSVDGLVLFAQSRSVRPLTDAVLLRIAPGDTVVHEGPIETAASALLRLDRRVRIVDGRVSNLAFGSAFPEARGTFWDDAALARAWEGPARVLLLTARAPDRSVVRTLPADRVHLLVEGNGRRLYSNRP